MSHCGSISTKWAVQVLEGILDDDADMADMYLARRAQLAANNAVNVTQQRADCDNSPNAPPKSGTHAPPCASQPCLCPSFHCTHHTVVFAALSSRVLPVCVAVV